MSSDTRCITLLHAASTCYCHAQMGPVNPAHYPILEPSRNPPARGLNHVRRSRMDIVAVILLAIALGYVVLAVLP